MGVRIWIRCGWNDVNKWGNICCCRAPPSGGYIGLIFIYWEVKISRYLNKNQKPQTRLGSVFLLPLRWIHLVIELCFFFCTVCIDSLQTNIIRRIIRSQSVVSPWMCLTTARQMLSSSSPTYRTPPWSTWKTCTQAWQFACVWPLSASTSTSIWSHSWLHSECVVPPRSPGVVDLSCGGYPHVTGVVYLVCHDPL